MQVFERHRGLSVSILVTVCLLVLGTGRAEAQKLTVVSWGGAFSRASVKAYHERFSRETGIAIDFEDYNGGLAQIRAQVAVGDVYWDVVNLEITDFARGCDEGLLEPLSIEEFPDGADGTPAKADFMEGTILACGVAMRFASTIFAYNERSIRGEKPSTIADFFDLDRFPGRRGMRRSPLVNLEFALMADGVPVSQVYEVLDTPTGVEQAFRKLDSIKDYIIWWETGAQPPQLLADEEVIMTTAYNGRIFNAQNLENQPFVIVWDGQVLDSGGLGIVAGTRNLDAAMEFVHFATTAQSMAGLTRYISYSPTRRSAIPLISTHAETGTNMRPHMPTTPKNTVRALYNDWDWWSDNGEEMNERFSTWLAR